MGLGHRPGVGRGQDVTIVVTPERWRAWDMASTFFRYLVEAGIPMDEPGRWFR
jgi:hypothetical protein